MTFLSCAKEFLRLFAAHYNLPKPNFNTHDHADHGYAMANDDEMQLSESEGSEIDPQEKKK